MRRGLMAWDPDEIPRDALRGRLDRLQTEMRLARQDAMILYTNFIRSGAVSHLTAFSPYWADGVLLVPQDGEPTFATTLSKRVGTWIQSVKPVGELVNSPTPAAVLGKKLAASAAKRVAIVELDSFPAGLYDELAAALSGVEIVDGSETYAAARSHLDDVERKLLKQADAIAKAALEQVASAPADVGAAVAAVERHTRLHGAEEAYVAIAPDLNADRRFVRLSGTKPLGQRFAIRATVAYKGAWVRRAKTYAQNEKGRTAIARADAWLSAFIARINVDRPLGEQIVRALAELPGSRLTGWMAEAASGSRPLAVVASQDQPNASLSNVPALIVTIMLDLSGVPWCGAGLASLVHGSAAS